MFSRRLCPLALALLAAAGCASQPPSFEEIPPADELYREGVRILEGRRILGIIPHVDYTGAIETFQTIIDNYPYSDYAVLSELKIADAYFADSKYDEALSYYRDFADLHPQHEQVPYTLYRAALCHERRVRSANRDQTPTREALVYLDRLLAKHPHSDYAVQAETLWRELRTRLAHQIANVGDFYRKRGEYESAAERYRTLLSEYPGLGFDATALFHLAECYGAMNRDDEAARIFQVIVQTYASSDVADDAAKRLGSGD